MSEIRYVYFRDQRKPGRVLTVAYRKSETEGDYLFAGALCKPKPNGDMFRKARGRQIAEGRMMVSPYEVTCDSGNLFAFILATYAKEGKGTSLGYLAEEQLWKMEKAGQLDAFYAQEELEQTMEEQGVSALN